MSVILPQPVGTPAGQWQLLDYLDEQYRSEPATGGQAVIDTGQLSMDERWLIDHMVVQCDSASRTTLRLYQSAIEPLRILDGAPNGNFAVADWPAGLQVRPQASLVAAWVGASDGARGILTLQGRIMRRVS